MRSAVAVCHILDDAEGCARYLAASIRKKLHFGAYSIGVMFCDVDVDGAAVTGHLKASLGFEVVGMTVLGSLTASGREISAVTLTVLTADDCFFAAVMSESLSEGDVERSIRETCGKALAAARKEGAGQDGMWDAARPELAIAFCPLYMPFPGDVYPRAMADVLGGVPVIGGMASDAYDNRRALVFFSGVESEERLALLCIFGRTQPVFAACHMTSRFAERIARVTEADINIVYKIGERTFIEYLEEFGFNSHVEEPLLAFLASPLKLMDGEGDEVPVMRYIKGLDHATGAGIFGGAVPVGALVNICLFKGEAVRSSCRQALALLLKRAKSAVSYSTVFCFSCRGRGMVLGLDGDAEGRIIGEMLPGGLAFSGAYPAGEIFPVHREARGGADGGMNRFLNCAITFCLL